jgi:hypothetical protein
MAMEEKFESPIKTVGYLFKRLPFTVGGISDGGAK